MIKYLGKKLMKYVTGEIVMDCDSDDYFHENAFQEIYNKYEIKSQEGEIYTFKVKDITNEEWDAFLKEYYNE